MATTTEQRPASTTNASEGDSAPDPPLPRWWTGPLLAALPAAAVPALAALGWIAADQTWRALVLTAQLPLVAALFGPLLAVDAWRRLTWVALALASIAVAGALTHPLPALTLVAVHLALAGMLSLAAYRDPRWQMRLCLREMVRGRLALAHRAYGRYLRLGRSLAPEVWRELRRREIPDERAAELRARYSGMVNACRYGDLHGLGDASYAALFPEVGEHRASAEEG